MHKSCVLYQSNQTVSLAIMLLFLNVKPTCMLNIWFVQYTSWQLFHPTNTVWEIFLRLWITKWTFKTCTYLYLMVLSYSIFITIMFVYLPILFIAQVLMLVWSSALNHYQGRKHSGRLVYVQWTDKEFCYIMYVFEPAICQCFSWLQAQVYKPVQL